MQSLRLTFIASGLVAALLSGGFAVADGLPKVTVYKSPSCGCCGKWVSHMQENGFEVETISMEDLRMVKSMSGVKPELASCHTARVGDYVVEGHVPAEDIKRLLAEHPHLRGLTAPGMPQSSPGMDVPNGGHYQVLSIDQAGNTAVFAQH